MSWSFSKAETSVACTLVCDRGGAVCSRWGHFIDKNLRSHSQGSNKTPSKPFGAQHRVQSIRVFKARHPLPSKKKKMSAMFPPQISDAAECERAPSRVNRRAKQIRSAALSPKLEREPVTVHRTRPPANAQPRSRASRPEFPAVSRAALFTRVVRAELAPAPRTPPAAAPAPHPLPRRRRAHLWPIPFD